jgi:ferredoxin, 2Fe-2S
MAKITYIEFGGVQHTVEVAPGLSVMEGAIRNDIPGIEAECGGACSCATCQVYVDEGWFAATGDKQPLEVSMLEFAKHPAPSSRLSCQVKVTEELDGLVVRLPESQR